jgi:hypothetical protein
VHDLLVRRFTTCAEALLPMLQLMPNRHAVMLQADNTHRAVVNAAPRLMGAAPAIT